jgi:hypothetical protein
MAPDHDAARYRFKGPGTLVPLLKGIGPLFTRLTCSVPKGNRARLQCGVSGTRGVIRETEPRPATDRPAESARALLGSVPCEGGESPVRATATESRHSRRA